MSWFRLSAVVVLVGSALGGDLCAGKIYWSDRNVGQLGRANLDGSERESVLEVDSNNLRGVALDVAEGRLYFADNQANTLSRVNLDGTGLETLVRDRGFPADVALDLTEGKLYWCDQARGVIERASLDGTAVEVVVATPSPYYLDIDPAGGRLFWGDFAQGNIFVTGLGDGQTEQIFTGQPRVRGVKLDGEKDMVVWCNRESNHIQRRRVAGGEVETVIGELDTPHGLVLDPPARRAYWCDTGTDRHHRGGKAIHRTDLDHGGVMETVAELSEPWDADLDLRTETFGAYVARYFFRDKAAAASEPGADLDGDGFVQLLEYALASHGDRKDLLPIYQMTQKGGRPVWVYRRFTGCKDLAYRVEVSDDMQVWRSNDDGVEVTGPESVRVLRWGIEEVSVPVVAPGQHVRLRATLKK